MSAQLSDTTNYKGIVQIYEKEIGVDYGVISGNTTKLKSLVADINLALDDFMAIAIQASGTWQVDDSNQTDYPIITTNLVSGQRDYSFTVDQSSNLILDIYRVLVANSSGVFSEILPVDQGTATNNNSDTISFLDGRNQSGTPTRYDKTANAIFLDLVPNYNYTNGIKLLVNRESSYFTYTDTTKKPGVPGLFHKYFALKPALDYARRNSLESYNRLYQEVLEYEGDEEKGMVGSIARYFGKRQKDVKGRLQTNVESCK